MNTPTDLIIPAHRGAYDRLWSEFRPVVLAVSLKASSRFARKLGAVPTRMLGLLEDLGHFCRQPKTDFMQSLLQVYLALKPCLKREERRELIEGFLAHDPNALDRFYELILLHRVESLYGCRLLFPSTVPARFFDSQDHPGVWHCLGPFLLHLRGQLLRLWLNRDSYDERELDSWCERLASGCHEREYAALPAAFRTRAERLGAIVRPGIRVWLHPQFSRAAAVAPGEPSVQIRSLALLALAEWWDEHPAELPLLPETDVWSDVAHKLAGALRLTLAGGNLNDALEQMRDHFRQAATAEQYHRTGWEEAMSSIHEESGIDEMDSDSDHETEDDED